MAVAGGILALSIFIILLFYMYTSTLLFIVSAFCFLSALCLPNVQGDNHPLYAGRMIPLSSAMNLDVEKFCLLKFEGKTQEPSSLEIQQQPWKLKLTSRYSIILKFMKRRSCYSVPNLRLS